MSSSYPNGGRLAQLAERSPSAFPPIPPRSDNPSEAEQIAAWRQLAAGYATIAHTYKEALPLIVQELHAIRSIVDTLVEDKAVRVAAKRLRRVASKKE